MEVNNGILQVCRCATVSESNLSNIKRITYGHNVLNDESGIYWFRLYNGLFLSTVALETLKKTTVQNIQLFGGYARQISDVIKSKPTNFRSYGEDLNGVDVEYEIFDNRTARHLIRRLITRYTKLQWRDEALTTDDRVVELSVWSGKVIDILERLVTFGYFNWKVNSLGVFTLYDRQGLATTHSFINGENGVTIKEYDQDDTGMRNEIRVVGNKTSYHTEEEFDLVNETVIKTGFPPNSVEVRVGAKSVPKAERNILNPDEYEVTIRKNTIIFKDAISDNVIVSYDYDLTDIFIQRDSKSIEKYGVVRSERTTQRQLSTYEDGKAYTSAKLAQSSSVPEGSVVELPIIDPTVEVGEVVGIESNYRPDKDGLYEVKEIVMKYPAYTTELVVGDHKHTQLEQTKIMLNKIHENEEEDTVAAQSQRYQSYSQEDLEIEALAKVILPFDEMGTENLVAEATTTAKDLREAIYEEAVYDDLDVYD